MTSENQEATTGKGRPTPKRKEAEAKRKQSIKVPTDKKAARIAMRERDMAAREEMRRAMYTNDDRGLGPRDRGPLRRFVRDFVDMRISVGELFIPFALVIMVCLFIPSAELQLFVSTLWLVMFLVLFVDLVVLRFRLRKALKNKFPQESLRGVVWYAFARSITLRAMRMPKPMIRVGGAPREVKIPKSLQR